MIPTTGGSMAGKVPHEPPYLSSQAVPPETHSLIRGLDHKLKAELQVWGPLRTPGLLQRLLTLEAAQGAPRDPRRDSRGERSPWLPLETRPDSLPVIKFEFSRKTQNFKNLYVPP